MLSWLRSLAAIRSIDTMHKIPYQIELLAYYAQKFAGQFYKLPYAN